MKRRRPPRCSYCEERGHNRATCPELEDEDVNVRRAADLVRALRPVFADAVSMLGAGDPAKALDEARRLRRLQREVSIALIRWEAGYE